MAIIDRSLVRSVNSGRCFAIVGSGPSCEEGFPSWDSLAKLAIGLLEAEDGQDVRRQAEQHLAKKDYPRVFQLVKDMGRGEALSELLTKELTAAPIRDGSIYKTIANWPFACYLTTNFEKRLEQHLKSIGAAFLSRSNSEQDITSLRGDSSGLVMHLHGVLDDPKSLVLTSGEYSEFSNSPKREYWRAKLAGALHMVDFVLIGYSARDPDFKDQLERARVAADPTKPVFMLACDLEDGTVKQLYDEYNIRVIGYTNRDGSHRELVRLLRRYDSFICKRNSPNVGLSPVDEDEAIIAGGMHLFTQLRISDESSTSMTKSYESLLLQLLERSGAVTIENLANEIVSKLHVVDAIDPKVLEMAVEELHGAGLVAMDEADQRFSLSNRGSEFVTELHAERSLVREKFVAACQLFVEREYGFTDRDAEVVIGALDKGLVRAFEHRGLEIARAVFSDDAVDVSDATDILDTVNDSATTIDEVRLRSAFADLMIEVLLRPSEPMRTYLAALCQGYFAFHALGLDPNCSAERLDIARRHKWVVDSSIAISLLAIGCQNHDYAMDLVSRMRELGMRMVITDRLVNEVVDHAYWAYSNFKNESLGSISVLRAAVVGPGFKQNLFIDGFASWANTAANPLVSEYFDSCFGMGAVEHGVEFEPVVRKRMFELGIEEVETSEMPNFRKTDWPERDVLTKKIEGVRQSAGTFRSEAQCTAEAEVLLLHRLQKMQFLSHSTVLDRTSNDNRRITWKPEALYRFLTMFSTKAASENLLYDSMIQEFYYSGFEIVDAKVLSQFAVPLVRQARLELKRERDHYVSAMGPGWAKDIEGYFESLPDEQKPFYSLQFALFMARKERTMREEAEQRASYVAGKKERAAELNERERQELLRLRNKTQRKQQSQKRKAGRKKKRRK